MHDREQRRHHMAVGAMVGVLGFLSCGNGLAADVQPAATNSSAIVQAKPADKSTDEAIEAAAYQNDEAGTEDDVTYNKDPLERLNRAIFSFNDLLDSHVVKPIATFYNAVVPKPLNAGIHNFFTNLSEVNNVINDILQLNAHQMANDFWRLGINTTFGLGGFIDMATRMHLPYKQNDFGLTLSKWGYKNSTYIVLPFLGPSTFRDGIIGLTVDYFAFSVYPYIEPDSRRYQVLGLLYIDHRANLLQFEPVLEEAAIDKYVFMRNAYMQHRQFQINQENEVGEDNQVVEATGSVTQ